MKPVLSPLLSIILILSVFMTGCGNPEQPPTTAFSASLLLERGVSETEFTRALSEVSAKYQVEFAVESFTALDSSTLPSGLCTSNLVRVQVRGAKEEALSYLTEAAAIAGSENAVADIDPRYGMGQAEVLPSSSANEIGPQAASSLTGKGVRIAILDTGFGKSETAFSQWSAFKSVISQRNFTSANNEDYYDRYTLHEGLTYSYEGHGTPIAVLAGGSYGDFKGVAPEAEIMPIKVCDDEGKCLVSHVVQGICYALNNAPVDDQGQRRLSNLVLNLSLGGDRPNKSLYEVLKFALENNVAVVTSAGNDGDGNPATKDSIQYPAAFGVTLDGKDAVPDDDYAPLPGLIVVAALEQKNDSYVPASFSSQAPYVTLAALGVNVKSGQAASVSFSDQFAGTSFATPQVVGALALLKDGYPYLPLYHPSAPSLKRLLLNNALPLGCDECTPETVGKGMLRPPTTPLQIVKFEVNPALVFNGAAASFSWEFIDVDLSKKFTCRVDVDGDGTTDITLSDCKQASSYEHIYSKPGSFDAKFIVENSIGIVAEQILQVIVAPWSRNVAHPDYEYATDVSEDESGVYVVGGTKASRLEPDAEDGFIVKLNKDGQEAWHRRIGQPTSRERVVAVATDFLGDVHVLGETTGRLGEQLGSPSANQDIFIAKFSKDGEPKGIRQFGTSDDDFASAIDVVEIYQGFAPTLFITGFSNGSGINMFVAKFNRDIDDFVFRKNDLPFDNQGRAVAHVLGFAPGSGDRVYVAGETSGDIDNNPDTGGDNTDVFVTSFDLFLSPVETTQLGTEAYESVTGIVANGIESFTLVGTTGGVIDASTSSFGGTDVFIQHVDKIEPENNKISQIGTAQDDIASDVDAGASGNLYIVDDNNLYSIKTGNESIVRQHTWNYQPIDCNFPSYCYDEGFGIAVSSGGSIYFSGSGKLEDVSDGTTEETGGAFIVKLDADGNIQ